MHGHRGGGCCCCCCCCCCCAADSSASQRSEQVSQEALAPAAAQAALAPAVHMCVARARLHARHLVHLLRVEDGIPLGIALREDPAHLLQPAGAGRLDPAAGVSCTEHKRAAAWAAPLLPAQQLLQRAWLGCSRLIWRPALASPRCRTPEAPWHAATAQAPPGKRAGHAALGRQGWPGHRGCLAAWPGMRSQPCTGGGPHPSTRARKSARSPSSVSCSRVRLSRVPLCGPSAACQPCRSPPVERCTTGSACHAGRQGLQQAGCRSELSRPSRPVACASRCACVPSIAGAACCKFCWSLQAERQHAGPGPQRPGKQAPLLIALATSPQRRPAVALQVVENPGPARDVPAAARRWRAPGPRRPPPRCRTGCRRA